MEVRRERAPLTEIVRASIPIRAEMGIGEGREGVPSGPCMGGGIETCGMREQRKVCQSFHPFSMSAPGGAGARMRCQFESSSSSACNQYRESVTR